MTQHKLFRARLIDALPFWLSLGMAPVVIIAVLNGGWWFMLIPSYAWYMTTLLDLVVGLNNDNPDPETPDSKLFWYRLITIIWFPIQAPLVFWSIWYVTRADYSVAEQMGLFWGIGIASGTIGIVYAHELMHQRNLLERWLGDLLMCSALYGHFRSEHLLVHHSWVGTPRDLVSARYGQGFWHYFLRVLTRGPASAWHAEKKKLARAGRTPWARSNPFWRYAALQLAVLALAFAIGGWQGLLLFCWQALVAVWQLELTNYVEHYGLTRKHLGDGRYEHVKPRHSWNSSHRVTNWLMINLQRHSDHHYKPDRRFPLLQTYSEDEAPQLPAGYPVMATLAMVPSLWRRWMNPRVREWRGRFYPEIKDWKPYNSGENPIPRGSL